MSRVTVCVTCYNHEATIAQCLDSVLLQRPDVQLEVLVGDDVSSDRSRSIINRYAEKSPGVVVPVFQEESLGASSNLQTLIARATGEYIAHVHGDDYWLPGKLKRQVELLQNFPEAVAVFCNAKVVRPDGDQMGIFNDRVPLQFDLDYLVKCGNFLNPSTIVYRKSARDPLLLLTRNFVDYRLNVLLAAQGSLIYANEAFVVNRWKASDNLGRDGSEKLHRRYLHAILDARRLGATQRSVDQCVQHFCRVVFYSSLLPPQPLRLMRYMALLRESRELKQGRLKLLRHLLVSILQLPAVGTRHLLSAMAGQKVFYPTRRHSS